MKPIISLKKWAFDEVMEVRAGGDLTADRGAPVRAAAMVAIQGNHCIVVGPLGP